MAQNKNGEGAWVVAVLAFSGAFLFMRLKAEAKQLKKKTSLGGMVEKSHGYQTWVVNVPGLQNGGAMLFKVRAATEKEAQERARHELHTKSLPDYTTVVPEYVWEEARQQ
jgi:hypothetical protein